MSTFVDTSLIPVLHGFGASITVASIVLLYSFNVVWANFLCFAFHECILITYINPLVKTVLWVCVAHAVGFYVVILILPTQILSNEFLVTIGISTIMCTSLYSVLKNIIYHDKLPHPKKFSKKQTVEDDTEEATSCVSAFL